MAHADFLRSLLAQLRDGRSLSRAQSEAAMDRVAAGEATDEWTADFLVALRDKGESIDEVAGFLESLRKKAVPLPLGPDGPEVMDVCGTGGDGSGSFNLSTTVAFVVAACGQGVAKHGNRSVSSRSGSFDVLEALGIRIDEDPASVARSIKRHGIGFLFAPAFHPAVARLAPVRRALGGRTVFNILGPLLNPAGLSAQMIGVYSDGLRGLMAEVLRGRGMRSALIVRGEDGQDEITLGGPTRVSRLSGDAVTEATLRPEDFGLRSAPASALKGGSADENAAILRAILQGETGPRRDWVLMNSAAALVVGGKARDFKAGVARAAQAVDSGDASRLLKNVGVRVP